jgi:hypothetical protein
LGNGSLLTKSLKLLVHLLVADYLVAACLPLICTLGPQIKLVRWDAGKLSRTVPIVAHLTVIAISLSHNFSERSVRCTNGGKTLLQTLPGSPQVTIGTKRKLSKIAQFAPLADNLRLASANLNSTSKFTSRWIPDPTCDTLGTCRQGADFL